MGVNLRGIFTEIPKQSGLSGGTSKKIPKKTESSETFLKPLVQSVEVFHSKKNLWKHFEEAP